MLRHAASMLGRALATSAAASPLRMTPRCAEQLQSVAAQRGQPTVLRVAVDGGGCSGFQYAFVLEPATSGGQAHEREAAGAGGGGGKSGFAPAEDLVFQEHGAEVRVDPVSFAFLKGATIDYVEEMISSSFRVTENPNSEASCGCGTSFTAKMDA